MIVMEDNKTETKTRAKAKAEPKNEVNSNYVELRIRKMGVNEITGEALYNENKWLGTVQEYKQFLETGSTMSVKGVDYVLYDGGNFVTKIVSMPDGLKKPELYK